MALAVLAAAGFDLMVPADFSIGTWSRIAYPVVLLLLLGLLVVGDPGRIDRERPWLRVTTGLMIGLITLSTAASAVRLVVGLLDKADFDSAAQLLSLGAAVWCTNDRVRALVLAPGLRGRSLVPTAPAASPAAFHFLSTCSSRWSRPGGTRSSWTTSRSPSTPRPPSAPPTSPPSGTGRSWADRGVRDLAGPRGLVIARAVNIL